MASNTAHTWQIQHRPTSCVSYITPRVLTNTGQHFGTVREYHCQHGNERLTKYKDRKRTQDRAGGGVQ